MTQTPEPRAAGQTALEALAVAAQTALEAPGFGAKRAALNRAWNALADAQLALDHAEANMRLTRWLATPEKAA